MSDPSPAATSAPEASALPTLLAVDLGLRTGLALFDRSGQLRWYRSQNFGSKARLKRAAYGLLRDVPDLAWVVVEGGGDLAAVWAREAERRQAQVVQIQASTWRRRLLLPRDRRDGATAKARADELARHAIEALGADRPTSLRHDAAEAILVGVWGLLKVGWLAELPPALRA